MGKITVLGLAVGACLWMMYHFVPEIAHTAFILPKVNLPITYTMLLGLALFVGFKKLIKK